MVPSQLWAFANDLYTKERGARLFPIIGLGTSLGAWIGAEVASEVFASLGPYRLMLFAAGGLVVCLLLTLWTNRREAALAVGTEANGSRRKPNSRSAKRGDFSSCWRQRYLLYIALLIMVLNIVNTLGEFLLGSLVESEAQPGCRGRHGRRSQRGGAGLERFTEASSPT